MQKWYRGEPVKRVRRCRYTLVSYFAHVTLHFVRLGEDRICLSYLCGGGAAFAGWDSRGQLGTPAVTYGPCTHCPIEIFPAPEIRVYVHFWFGKNETKMKNLMIGKDLQVMDDIEPSFKE